MNSELGPLLAQTEQDGYVLRIYKNPIYSDRKGIMTITAPDGRAVRAGFWMDFPEDHWPLKIRRNYKSMPENERAALEANEQLRYGLPANFEYHFRLGEVIESIVRFVTG